MFNIGSGELVLIAVVALLVLGPKRLPELARGIGKFLREFRRQTDEVRGVVEREFYKMDQEMDAPPAAALPAAADAPPTSEVPPTPAALPLVVASEGAVPVDAEPMDHSDPRHPDYDKPEPEHYVTPEEPAPAAAASEVPAPAAPVASAPAEPSPVEPEKKAS